MTMRYTEEEPEDTSVESPEAKAAAEDFRREMVAWRQNPMTTQVRLGLEDQAALAYRNLLSSARGSADASVARYAAQYDALQALIKNMKEQQ